MEARERREKEAGKEMSKGDSEGKKIWRDR